MARPRKPAVFGPFSGGLNLRDEARELRASDSKHGLGELSYAVNIDVDGAGWPNVRDGWVRIDESVAHSGFKYNGETYAVIDGDLSLITTSGLQALAPVVGELHWVILDGVLVFSDANGIYQIGSDNSISTLPASGDPNRYSEQNLARMPAGKWLHRWNGRLVLARGTSLYFSEPMWYGVYDVARGILPLGSQIRWMAPLEEGIYVGLQDETLFLQGRDPLSLKVKRIPGRTVQGAAAAVSTQYMDAELVGEGVEEVAVWFSASGFTIGRPSGSIVNPQAERLDIAELGAGKLSVVADRFILLPREINTHVQ